MNENFTNLDDRLSSIEQFTGSTAVYSANVHSSNGVTEVGPSWISGINVTQGIGGNASTAGDFRATLNFVSSVFQEPPVCTCTPVRDLAGGVAKCQLGSATSTSLDVYSYGGGQINASQDSNYPPYENISFNIICMGSR